MVKTQFEKPVRWWDSIAAVILLVAIFLTSMRLVATAWTDELRIIQGIAMAGVILGLVLGQSLFSPRVVLGYSLAVGAFVVFRQIGLEFLPGIQWPERFTSMTGRLGISFENLFKQRAVTDPILFIFLMGTLFWGISTHAGYTLTRYGNAWRAMLPAGLSLFIIHIHDPYWTSRSWFLAGFIFLALLLLSRIYFLQKQHNWRESRTHLPPYIGLDFLRTTVIAGMLFILIPWTAPALAASLPPAEQAWDRLSRPLYDARAKMSSAFASLRATVGIVNDYYGDVLPLGRGNLLTDVVVFQVEAPPRPTAGVRYYWRARVYDTWTGTQWAANPNEFASIDPNETDIILPNLDGRWEATFRFLSNTSLSTLYTVPQPQWVSRPTDADIILAPDGTVDILRLRSSPSIRPGEIYEVQSSLTNVTMNELRVAGTDYPEWVTERYLQVPETITKRIRDLASLIAADYDNPYDITAAVTQYMRDNIQYTDTIPTPPANQDLIDWMLFDLKQGFCNYYATAEIMMLRSLGIPSRMAVGYAQGQRDPATNIYTVRQRDAHAWVEVYFPGIGWVEFEPTVNQSPLRRPIGDPINEDNTAFPSIFDSENDANVEQRDLGELLGFEPQEDQVAPDPEELVNQADENAEQIRGWLTAAGVLVLFAVLYTWYQARVNAPENPLTPVSVQVERTLQRRGWRVPAFIRRMAARGSLSPQAKAYNQLNKALTRLGASPTPDWTPYERAASLKLLLPEAREEIEVLLNEYQALMYGSLSGDAANGTGREAVMAARSVRLKSWQSRLGRYLSRFQQPEERKTLV